ncbi:MAG: hypothetical protein ACLRQF_05110 [Thomasclavelia ramosa]
MAGNFGVNAIPEYRQQGLAAKVMRVVIDARMAGRKDVFLLARINYCIIMRSLDLKIVGFLSQCMVVLSGMICV